MGCGDWIRKGSTFQHQGVPSFPQPLSFLISKSYNPIDSSISIGENIINFSEDDVQNVRGLPKGELMFENSYNIEYTDVWRS